MAKEADASIKRLRWIDHRRRVAGALRVLGITTEQTRALRKRKLIEDYQSQDEQLHRRGSYWGIATHIDNYKKGQTPFPLMVEDNTLTESLKAIRTRLNPFSDEEQGHLINWGYALTDAAMRRYVIEEQTPVGNWPIKEYALGGGSRDHWRSREVLDQPTSTP